MIEIDWDNIEVLTYTDMSDELKGYSDEKLFSSELTQSINDEIERDFAFGFHMKEMREKEISKRVTTKKNKRIKVINNILNN